MDVSAAIMTEGADKCGSLIKLGKIRKNWKKRWFVLKDNSIYYYESNKAPKPKGEIELTGSTTTGVETAMTEPTFCVNTPKRKWQIRCSDATERDEWIAAINKNLNKMPGRSDSSPPVADPSPATPAAAAPAAASAAPAAVPAPAPAADSTPPAASPAASPDSQELPPGVDRSKVLHTAVVNFDFTPMHSDELSLTEGMFLWVVEKRDDGWWRGYTSKGEFGLFPGNFATAN